MINIHPKLMENPVNFLVTYDEVIRDANIMIFNKILKHHKKQLMDYIDFSKFKNSSPEKLAKDLSLRKLKNPLEWIAIKKFNYEKEYNRLYDHYKDIYTYDTHVMLNALKKLSHEKFVENIYIYSKDYDVRKAYDININFKDVSNKVTYVNGPYIDVVKQIPSLQFIIDNDVDRVEPIIKDNTISRKINFMIAKYGYNYILNEYNKPILKNDILKTAVKEKINLVEFTPVTISEKSFLAG